MYLIESVIARLNGWKEMDLYMGAEEIILKAVIQSIPPFAMEVFNPQEHL